MMPEEIKALRDRLGWTQERMARELGVSWTTVSRWENGKVEPSRLAVLALERVADQAHKRRPGPAPARREEG